MAGVTLDAAAAEIFIRRHTLIASPPIVPEIALYLASEITPIWQATEAELAAAEVPPPFWAFAWAGGQALARHILDHPDLVRGRRVLDFGAGSGLGSIAAALAGAAHVRAVDIDPIACTVIGINAALNGVAFEIDAEDVIGSDPRADVVLVGDMCYERPLAERLLVWLREAAARGVLVLLGDPGRNYSPASGVVEIARYSVPTSLELEDRTERSAAVFRLEA
jgi:predicted nicotinamide N-methyase